MMSYPSIFMLFRTSLVGHRSISLPLKYIFPLPTFTPVITPLSTVIPTPVEPVLRGSFSRCMVKNPVICPGINIWIVLYLIYHNFESFHKGILFRYNNCNWHPYNLLDTGTYYRSTYYTFNSLPLRLDGSNYTLL